MSMSTHAVGFKAPDGRWKAMKAVWDACKEARIDPPDDVDDYFNGEDPEEQGVVVEIEETDCCKEWSDGERCASGFQIDLKKLPKDLTHIRVYNSW